jgi:hypothetical protein
MPKTPSVNRGWMPYCLVSHAIFVSIICVLAAAPRACGDAGAASPTGAVPLEQTAIDGSWRDLQHGGFNALYFLLKVYGEPRNYEQCLAEACSDGLPQTVSDIIAAARKLDCPLHARFVSPEQLSSLRLPAIVHMEGDSSANGYFFVVLQIQSHQVIYLDGPSATICTIDRESFLRRWSGIAVGPTSHSIWTDAALVTLGAVCSLGLASVWYRR